MKSFWVAVISVLFLAGCVESTATGSVSRVQMRHSAYLGKKLGVFILGNGAPYHSSRLSGGGKVYAWNSKIPDIYPYSLGSEKAMDHFVESACEIRIYTDSTDRIRRIDALNDPARDWDVSACAAYLK